MGVLYFSPFPLDAQDTKDSAGKGGCQEDPNAFGEREWEVKLGGGDPILVHAKR